jgi:hypothetical protein
VIIYNETNEKGDCFKKIMEIDMFFGPDGKYG